MYNRYIPGSNGVYEKHSVLIPDAVQEHASGNNCKEQTKRPCETGPQTLTSGWDLGDLLLLCIVILLLLDSEDGDILPILIAAAAFLFLQ